ncbi:MAG: methyltetrahydrofolate cobalamin methyltransferase, partial [Deltaproteobacteria bacterium]|nr:methyltetrahydrofolate cobalamin methyltransferase [Deltaproteobacteria bacterium]
MLIIGEKINSSIPSVKKAIAGKDKEYLAALARDQAEAGADYIDV